MKKPKIPKIYLIVSIGVWLVLLLFILLNSYLSYAGFIGEVLFVIYTILIFLPFLLFLLGLYLLYIFREEKQNKKYIKISIYLNALLAVIIIVGGTPVAFGQQSTFNQDSRNLEQRDSFLFKAYSQIEIDRAWDLLNENESSSPRNFIIG